jgi:single-strand DNA-binding protein
MSSIGLNKWIVSGHLAADAQVKTVELKRGEQAQLAEATLYVRKPRDWKESFTVRLTIWERSAAWRKLPYLKKGSLVICTGSVEPNPYISSNGNVPKAGLELTVLDIDLDSVRNADDETQTTPEASEGEHQTEANGQAANPFSLTV